MTGHARVARAIPVLSRLSLALLAGTVVGLPPARAQNAAADTDNPQQTVVVTGSRIATPELQAMTPVTVLSAKAIEASGELNIADFLRDLPSVGTSNLSSTNSNFLTNNAGVNSINLRNLGDQRTLVPWPGGADR